jgi:hypothetical protein
LENATCVTCPFCKVGPPGEWRYLVFNRNVGVSKLVGAQPKAKSYFEQFK